MRLPFVKTPLQKEMQKLEQQEQKFLHKRLTKKENILTQKLADKVPDKLQQTLDAAFSKAFALVFDKGTGIIEKTYDRQELEIKYQVKQQVSDLRQDSKSLRSFAKTAKGAGTKNLLLSGASGIGLGVLGIGLPDIPLFTGLLLKNVYEAALNFGFDYETPEEQYFILLLIQGAVSYGEQVQTINEQLNEYIAAGRLPEDYDRERQIRLTADALSRELLYMKFLQGIPLVGAVGGAYDAVYMKRVTEYAELKYRRRFLLRSQLQGNSKFRNQR